MSSLSSSSRRQRLARHVLAVSLALASGLSVHAAWGQAAAAHYDVPAGPLAEALTRYARAAAAVLSFDPAHLRGLSTAGLKGEYGVAEGFARLLAGSGLQARQGSDGVWSIQPAAGAQTLAPIAVTGLGGSTTQTFGYVAKASQSATKTDTPLIETPQSISVITRDQMTEQGAQSLNQVLRYTAGVATETRGATATRLDQFTVRGFSASTYLDGMRVFGGRDALPQVDAYRLERVDVLKGPSSVMYGQGGPGGVVNQVSKRPMDERYNEVEVQAGNYHLRRLNMDFSGPIDDDATLLYRLNGSAYDTNGQISHTKEQRYFIAPAFTWRPNADTSLTVLTHFQHDPDMGSYGAAPPMRTVMSAPDGRKLSARYYDGDADFEKSDRKSYSLGYIFEHRFNDTFKASQSLRFQHSEGVYRSVYGASSRYFGYTGPDYLYQQRASIATDVDVDAFTIDNNLQANLHTGPLSHTILLGFDYQHIHTDTLAGYGSAPPQNVFNPNYHMNIAVPAFSSDQTQRQLQTGLYAQDQIKWDRLSLLLGGRYDWARTHTGTDNLATSRHSSSSLAAEAFTGRAGLIYNFDNGLAPYASYSESFEPQSGTGWNNQAFKPIEGKQYEVGLKYQPVGSNALVTVAAFDIRRDNMLTTDPDPAHMCGSGRCQIQAGQVRTKGFELEAKAEVLRGLSVTAAYTYLDNKYEKANADTAGLNLKGHRPAGVPAHQASVWTRYQLQDGPLAGLGLGAGVRYLGSSWGNDNNTYKVPSTTLVDLMLDYDLGRMTASLKGMQVALNVSNLFNKEYIATCSGDAWCWFGYQRSIKASLRYRW
ncbi:TonB-dependent siderophore receptor [Bordetella holmesii]|uniref:TonB-dependent siderophore receptor n=1 Tax=Bordetella holmesii CDC-H585-BH TaxID=1331206 RepID=A0A158M3Y0_9BORD|nr:TonB-dependent siderophore receptor [Bordetella holmesii]KAK85004.1 TonB-dependent siderophore receptor [Bordetella holmesii CDC-H809-BH]KAK90032.1 TonB-dependent siderophore receptor [Bordetella holmesii CDC-H585-BH]KCV01332.1 putative ferrichrome-iron receptor FhuA [Bordetella holmesii CDC-H629-BH]KCV01556.1 TonB-dependent siderophore receptor [Bordetella holmesii CDC-H719-BH]KCV09994.1 TonB-dependent siderophore receptor [Bordetella holmesii 04P3421]KCV16143.1 putative ferrichrome-iron 